MLIDAHVHLDRYGDLLDEVLREIEARNIFTVATAMDAESYTELVRIAERSPLVLPTFGVHPRRAPQVASRLSDLSPLIETSPAIGEIGLDFHWEKDTSNYPAQRRVLKFFLAAAREQNKFVNLHTKGGEQDILDLLDGYGISRAIIHWYSGPMDVFHAMARFGCYFTVGVEVLYSDVIKTIAQAVPEHLLLTETDNPGGLKWLRGEPGMPRAIESVVGALAELRASTPERIEQLVHENFTRLIADDPWLTPARELLSRA